MVAALIRPELQLDVESDLSVGMHEDHDVTGGSVAVTEGTLVEFLGSDLFDDREDILRTQPFIEHELVCFIIP